MLQRVVLGQVRFNLPGLGVDARGVVGGKQLCARFAAIDRLVSFLRVLSAEQSLDDLQPGLRIVTARGGAGTREAIVLLPFASPALGDVVAQAVRLAGGQTFTGTGRHFVQFRDARAPLGYDVAAPVEGAGDLILHGAEQGVPYKIESELALATLLTRLSLVRVFGPAAALPAGPLMLTARRGLGAVVAGYLHRATRAAGLRASAALCEGGTASAFSPGASFWLYRTDYMHAATVRAQRYEAMGGRVRWHGKPFPSVYATCFNLLGIADKHRIIAVGDSLRTDIAGANGAGIDSILVTGGIHAAELGVGIGEQPDMQRLAAAIAASGHTPTAVVAEFRF